MYCKIPEFIGPFKDILPEYVNPETLPDCARESAGIYITKTSEGEKAVKLTFQGQMSDEQCDALKDWVSTPEAKTRIERIFRQSNGLDPDTGTVKPRSPLAVPGLAVQQGNLFELFEDQFLEHPWDLRECNALLSETEFAAESPKGQHGEISVTDAGKVQAQFVSELQQQMALFASDDNWTLGVLAHWLDMNIPHPDIPKEESGVFLTRAVQALIEQRGIPFKTLVHDKYRLCAALAAKIEAYRHAARTQAFQAFLLPECETPLVVSPEVCFTFEPGTYPFSRRYQGRYKFKKHFYEDVGDLNAEGEEFECAQFIDQLGEVEVWVRNLERRQSTSFWLQTATDKFYPDFVCELTNGKFLVIEYKGSHLWGAPDAIEKRMIGEKWAELSKGKCVFVMPNGPDWNSILAKLNK